MNAIQTDSYGIGNLTNAASSAGELAESLAKRAETAISTTLGVGKTVTGTGTLRELSEELGSLGTYLGRVRDRVLAADAGLPGHIIEELKREEANALRELNKSLNDATGYSPESLAASELKGRQAAERVANGPLANTEAWTDEEFELVTSELDELADDPVAAGAFFTELRNQSGGSEVGVLRLTNGLATYQRSKGLNDARQFDEDDDALQGVIDQAIVNIDAMMSGAHAADALPSGFVDGIAETFESAPEHLAALLSFGTFGEDFLVELEGSMFARNKAAIDANRPELYYRSGAFPPLGSRNTDGPYFGEDAMTALLAATARTPEAARRILYPKGPHLDYDPESIERARWEYYAARNVGQFPHDPEATANGLALAAEAVVHTNVDQGAERDKLAGYTARDLVIALDGRADNIAGSGTEAVAGVLATYPDSIGDAAKSKGNTDVSAISDGQPVFLSSSLLGLFEQIGKDPDAAREVQSALVNDWDEHVGEEKSETELNTLLQDRMQALGAILGAQGKYAADQAAFEDAAIGLLIDLMANVAKLAPTKLPGQGKAIDIAEAELKDWLAKPDGQATLAGYADADRYQQLGGALVVASMIQTGVIDFSNYDGLEHFAVDGRIDLVAVAKDPDGFKNQLEVAGVGFNYDLAEDNYAEGWEWATGKDWPKNHLDD